MTRAGANTAFAEGLRVRRGRLELPCSLDGPGPVCAWSLRRRQPVVRWCSRVLSAQASPVLEGGVSGVTTDHGHTDLPLDPPQTVSRRSQAVALRAGASTPRIAHCFDTVITSRGE